MRGMSCCFPFATLVHGQHPTVYPSHELHHNLLPLAMASEKRRICEQQRQAFVDCMFVHSRCVQAGEKPFKECMQAELDASTMHAECTKRFRAYITCWHQIVRYI